MNQKSSAKIIQRGLWMGALLLSAAAASASTTVTFQVDMTEQVGNGFTPGSDTVSVHGTFNSWGAFGLTNNPNAANPNLYTGTTVDTSDTSGGVIIYKYVTDANNYESTADGDNRCAQLPAGGSLLLPYSYYDDAGPSVTANVTFQVDMAEEINIGAFDTNTGSYVEVRGLFNGWSGGSTLTNDPTITTTNAVGIVTSNVYTGTFAITAATNSTQEYKYVVQPGTSWDGPANIDSDFDNGNNRFFVVATATLPIVAFDDKPLTTTVTDQVTFEVDMTALIISGAFNTNETVTLNGDFNNWSGQTMTNNPDASNPYIYSTTISITDGAGASHAFKFVENGTYESLANNRTFNLLTTSGNETVGPLFFNNQPAILADFLAANSMVTFTVNMTNAVESGSQPPYYFDPSVDTVWINGLNGGLVNNFWSWAQAPFPGGASGFQMTQIGDSSLYTITLPVNQGQSADLIYKYSIDGYDNEAGFADNHERWVRSQPNYTMPVDVFGSQGADTQSEISFGDLAITSLGANKVQLSWLGRNGVFLQSTPNLSSGSWTSLPLTDGTNLTVAAGGMASTNITAGAGSLFFRLSGPQ